MEMIMIMIIIPICSLHACMHAYCLHGTNETKPNRTKITQRCGNSGGGSGDDDDDDGGGAVPLKHE